MPSIGEIIKQIQKDLCCPACGRKYEIGEIRLKGLFNQTLIVQTICTNGHMAIFMTNFKKERVEEKPISTNDIIALHQALEKFDGDFQKEWSR